MTGVFSAFAVSENNSEFLGIDPYHSPPNTNPELGVDGRRARQESLLKIERAIERKFTFRHFAIKCLSKNYGLAEGSDRNIGYVKAIKWSIQNEDWGLLKWFGSKDVPKITTREFRDYMEHLTKPRPELSETNLAALTCRPCASPPSSAFSHTGVHSEGHGAFSREMIVPRGRGYWLVLGRIQGTQIQIRPLKSAGSSTQPA